MKLFRKQVSLLILLVMTFAFLVPALVSRPQRVLAASAGTFTEYSIPTSGANPEEITTGPDGALWFVENYVNNIGRITTAGVVTEYPIPTADSCPKGITAGSDGALWFTEYNGNKIGRITTAGVVTEYPVPTANSKPYGITAGPDGNLWFTESGGNKIGRITTAGGFTEYPIPTAGSYLAGITAGPDGNLWFTEYLGNKIGRITTAGVVTEYPVPTANSIPYGITAGPDGNLWFTELDGNNIGRITTTGAVTEYPVSNPYLITAGPDGALWFAENFANKIGRITTAGVVTEYPTPNSSDDPFAITSGPDGALWFTEWIENNIVKYEFPTLAFNSADHTTFAEGGGGSFTVDTTDSLAALTESGALPNGVTFTDNGNGTATLAGTPAAGTAGSYGITISASHVSTVDQSFTLTVVDLSLATVLGQAISASGIGTPASPKEAAISVTKSVDAVSAGDFAPIDPGATVTFYGTDSTFTTPETGSVSLAAGGETTVYSSIYSQDGSIDFCYAVSIARESLSSAKNILTFNVTGQVGNSVIDAVYNTVSFTMPYETDVSALAPVITVSSNATISPASGTPENFGSPVTYTVTAEDSSTQDWTAACTVQQPPAAPTGLTATRGNRTVTLSWDAVADATEYHVYQGTASGAYAAAPVETTGGTSCAITGLTNGTKYYFAVKAVNSIGEGGYSNEASATPRASGGGSSRSSGSGTSQPANNTGTGSANINPTTGGTFWLNNEASVTFPPGALNGAESLPVTIQKDASPPSAPSGFMLLGSVYQCAVGNTEHYTFNAPVTLTFKFDPSKVPAGETPAVFYYDNTTNQWVNIGGTVSSDTITVTVDHLTQYAVMAAKSAPDTSTITSFSDIPSSYWAYSSIADLSGRGIVSGYPDGTFRPGSSITRAEFVSMLVKALQLQSPSSGRVFTDTAAGWARDSIATAEALGIVSGYEDNTFRPDDPITREQMAVMVMKAAKLSPATERSTFGDSGNISPWAEGGISTVVNQGIMKGYPDNTFRPKANATRAEAVTVILSSII